MPGPIIRVHDLHRYFGSLMAVKGVSFDIMEGQVVGFIGANGAGKTTTMRMMVTLDSPDEGAIEICGMDVLSYPGKVRSRIGWMPDAFGTYSNVTVWEYLDFYARAYGYRGVDRTKRTVEVMEFTDLDSLAERPMDSLSKGMTQRLCLGRTLLHDPDVLILDEPAAGLDPKARIEFKNLVRLLASRGKTIFISSHILSELGEMCDTMLFIDKGQIVHHGSAESLKYNDGDGFMMEVRIQGDNDKLAEWVEFHPGVALVEKRKDDCLVSLEGDNTDALSELLQRLVSDGLPVIEYHRVQQKLEDAFVNVLKKLEDNGSGE